MKWVIQDTDITQVKLDTLVLLVEQGQWESNPHFQKLNGFLGNLLLDTLKKEKFNGKELECRLFTLQGKPFSHLLILGLGDKKGEDSLNLLRRAGGRIIKHIRSLRSAEFGLLLPESSGLSAEEITYPLTEGVLLSCYGFYRYKKKPDDYFEVETGNILAPNTLRSQIESGLTRAELASEAANLARDLVNTPANDMYPEELGRRASTLKGVDVKVYSLAEIQKMKMGSFLGVGLGSTKHPPVFIEMHYKPKKSAKKKIVLIGKGVTFDSGGLSLKPPKSMETMKHDMAGAAAVISFMSIASRLEPEAEIWGLVAATENMPDGHAMKPGDVITSSSGKTIEVLNTDAEGRLTLADAIEYGLQKKPDLMIDMATLTGACMVALGLLYAGVMGNDPKLIDQVISCGNKTGEKMWALPLAEEYKEDLKSPIADLKNVGGSYGGTITAGLFLQEFVGKTPWVHVDIAGPSWTEKPREHESFGGTGFMVRTLIEFIKRQ